MKKTLTIYKGLLYLLLIMGVFVAVVVTEISGKDKLPAISENAGNNNVSTASLKSGLEPENPEFVKYQKEKMLSQEALFQEVCKKGYLSALLDFYYRLRNAINNYEISEVTTSPYSRSALENTEFIKRQTNKNSSQTGSSVEKYKTGFVPAPVDRHHLSKIPASEFSSSANNGLQQGTQNVRKVSSSQTDLYTPAYYDLRTLNKVTNVQDQGNLGACWAFATYASLESYLMPQENWDFSENHMKNLLSPAYPEGFDINSDDGGNEFMSTAYLARWSGPAKESDDPYSSNSIASPQSPSIRKHVQDVLFLPDRQNSLDNQEIKLAIQNYGAVFTTMYFDPTFYSPYTYSYYYNGTSDINHAVAIVGWNDSFDKNLFSNVPPGNGAFIVKNDWGTDWGDKGYFYVSYYDSDIGNYNSIFTAENPDNYKNIYQYDPLGWTANYGYSNSMGWCANIFTSKSDEILKAVSFYTTDSNCKYEIFIYINPKSNPTNQEYLDLGQSGVSSFAGYHTVPLDSGIKLKADQKFSVVLKLTNPEDNNQNTNYPIAVEKPIDGYSSKAIANAGESFVSPDGKTWTDMRSSSMNTNVCIKAFTIPSGVHPIANFSANPISGNYPLTVQFTDLSQNTASISWNFGDGTNSTDQNPIHIYSAAGNYTVNLTVSNANGTDSKLAKINVLKSTPIITWSNPDSIIYGTAMSSTQLNANASVPGSFIYTPRNGTVLSAGIKTLNVDFTPTDFTNYTTASMNVTITVQKANPIITWENPADITYGTKLSNSQLNAVASVPGTFAYTPTAETVLNAGKDQQLQVVFTPTDTANYNSATKNVIINVSEKALPVLPVADFSANVTSGSVPLSVEFTDLSKNATKWSWDFGDGTNSTDQNPIHIYSEAGNYTVNLTVSNANGINLKIATITVSILQPVLPVANFSSNVTQGYAPLNIRFSDLSKNSTSWVWDFGDGVRSIQRSPMHTYVAAGSYNVVLLVSNENGTASKITAINVMEESSSSGSSDNSGNSSDGSDNKGNSSDISSSGGSGDDENSNEGNNSSFNISVESSNGESSSDSSSSSSGGSESSGGGGAGGSPESQSNVEIKEISQAFVKNGQSAKFDFPQKTIPVVYVSFDSKKTVGQTTTIVETLKNKSTLVSGVPSDEVYKFVNIWVGSGGYATEKTIENAVVSFKVTKSWVQDKKIDKSTITLNRYSDKTWNQLPTSLSSEDDNYLYLTAQTSGFSYFAITGKTTASGTVQPSADKTQPTADTKNNTNNGSTVASAQKTPKQKESQSQPPKQSKSLPGFEVVLGVAGLVAVFLYRRK